MGNHDTVQPGRLVALASTCADAIPDGWSLALIGNASGRDVVERGEELIRGVFDKETRRKPLAFAADAVPYGI